MNQTTQQLPTINTNGRIAFIQAGWHADIVEQARLTFIEDMAKGGVPESRIDIFDIPGVLEAPLQAKLLALSGQYSVIICAGFVVNGGIYRHDFVSASIIDGIMQAQLEMHVPILSVMLTPHNFHEHEPHHDFFFKHFQVKGREAAAATLKTLENLKVIKDIYDGKGQTAIRKAG
ncbi:MAG TPA: 6,7-dimethyl-8-ribityllumazine synthase [Alphaproteobacteria bacterium]|nr:6,7-dimethyl-8-ribityllumazine synthase [Alphaproteobacteria bacterium]